MLNYVKKKTHGYEGNMQARIVYESKRSPKIHVLFVKLYQIYGLKYNYCFKTSTHYFIYQQILNIQGLKS